MEKLFDDGINKDANFILNWMLFNWHVFNFTEYTVLKAFKINVSHVQKIIKVAFLNTNEHFVKELLDNVPNIDTSSVDGNSLLHLVCQSSVHPAEKAKLVKKRHSHLFSKPNKNGLLPVHIAILNKDLSLCKVFYELENIDINALTKDKYLSPLHIAVHFGMNKHVAELLKHSLINVSVVDLNGDTPLHHAVGRRHFATFALLANDKRCNRHITNKSGKRAEDDLAAYITKCSTDDFIHFAQSGFMDIADRHGNTPLHLCCMDARDGFEKFRYLVDQHSYLLKKANRFQNRPIHAAARNKDKRFLEYVLKQNVFININAAGSRERTPLHMVCFKGYTDHVELLLHDFDININAQDVDGNTPLHIASVTGYFEIIKLLKACPWCRTDITNAKNQTATDVANATVKTALKADKCTVKDLKDMMESNGVKYVDKNNNTLMHICASSKHFSKDKVSFLVAQNRESMFKHNNKGYMPIHAAAAQNNVEVVELLAKEDCINALTCDKRTPLHIASYYGSDSTIVRLLMFKDVEVNMQDINHDTPAHLAAQKDLETLYLLENHPKYIHGLQNKQGNTPYDLCSSIQSLKIFCSTGSASNVSAMVSNLGRYLTIPVEKCLLAIVMDSKTEKLNKMEILLNNFADVLGKYSDDYGNSLFHLALFARDTPLLQLLLDKSTAYGFLNRRDTSGYTTWDYASLNADIEAIRILETHPLFEQSVYGLTALASTTFRESNRIPLPSYGCTLHKIKNKMWCCTNRDITIYDGNLRMIRDIKMNIGEIYSLADLGDMVAAASSTGLFVLTYMGEQVRYLKIGYVTDVRSHNGQLFCVFGKKGKGIVGIQVYDTRTWDRIRIIPSPCVCSFRYPHTFHVGSEHITLACYDTAIIYTITHQGEHVHNTRRGEFVLPFMCHTGSDAALLVDFGNDRLQLRYAGEWSPLKLEPQPQWPWDAVYAGGALFVLCPGPNMDYCRIIKYVPT